MPGWPCCAASVAPLPAEKLPYGNLVAERRGQVLTSILLVSKHEQLAAQLLRVPQSCADILPAAPNPLWSRCASAPVLIPLPLSCLQSTGTQAGISVDVDPLACPEHAPALRGCSYPSSLTKRRGEGQRGVRCCCIFLACRDALCRDALCPPASICCRSSSSPPLGELHSVQTLTGVCAVEWECCSIGESSVGEGWSPANLGMFSSFGQIAYSLKIHWWVSQHHL